MPRAPSCQILQLAAEGPLQPQSYSWGKRRLTMAMLSPVVPPKKKTCYRYESYREAWSLFTKSRAELRCCHN